MKFRDMRRAGQALPPQECEDILRRGSCGVLAVSGDGGFPYAVPLSYVWREGRLFFHCAAAGHKLDAIAAQPKVSFCVVDEDQIVPERYTTYFRSVIVFGTAEVLTDTAERRAALLALAEKYCPDHMAGAPAEIDGAFHRTVLVAITPEHISGKAAIELLNAGQTPSRPV